MRIAPALRRSGARRQHVHAGSMRTPDIAAMRMLPRANCTAGAGVACLPAQFHACPRVPVHTRLTPAYNQRHNRCAPHLSD